jgi:hypothetical protein
MRISGLDDEGEYRACIKRVELAPVSVVVEDRL